MSETRFNRLFSNNERIYLYEDAGSPFAKNPKNEKKNHTREIYGQKRTTTDMLISSEDFSTHTHRIMRNTSMLTLSKSLYSDKSEQEMRYESHVTEVFHLYGSYSQPDRQISD